MIKAGGIYPFVSPDEMEWKDLLDVPLSPAIFPPGGTSSFYLLKELEHGQLSSSKLERKLIWKQAWGISDRHQGGPEHLYLDHTPQPTLLNANKEALCKLDKVGYQHTDLSWWHVGFYLNETSGGT